MATLVKRKRVLNGKHSESGIWYIRFMDHARIRRIIPAFTDKAASMTMMNRVEKLVVLRVAGEEIDVGMMRWLENLPSKTVETLGRYGILPKAKITARKPLAQHLADWEAALGSRKIRESTIATKVARVRKVMKACEFYSWSDLDALRIATLLSDWQNEGALAAQTRNHYVQHLKQFCKWMVDHGRAAGSPLGTLRKCPVITDRRIERRALSSQHFKLFIITTRDDEAFVHGMDGRSRAALYLTARSTGLRWSEIRALDRSAFVLEGDKPMVLIKAKDEKHPKGIPIPLTKDVAALLREYFAQYPGEPTDKAFAMPSRRIGAELVRHDLARAGIPDKVDGKVYDFHALRGQLATDMARAGIAP
ncbi:MAG: site-specific integrase, partial [Planctomycetota bacterium]|nr:site-specific integrase [Planctomycetota bacterium]